jgi:chemotaxis response regulator CheB
MAKLDLIGSAPDRPNAPGVVTAHSDTRTVVRRRLLMGGGSGRDAIENRLDVVPSHVEFTNQDVAGDFGARDIVVVGASAGGVEALQKLVAGLPGDLPAAVFVVLHIPRTGPGALAAILDRAGPLTAVHAEDGDVVMDGRIYVAPPDHHLVVGDGRVRLTQEAAVNGHRPSVDALFQSARSGIRTTRRRRGALGLGRRRFRRTA